MTNFTDNPEKIGRNSNRRKSRNMADAGNKDPQHQKPEEEHQGDVTGDKDAAAPTEMYLPDLDNTPLSQALKNGLDWGMEDEVMVECLKLKQYFRVDTLLIQRISRQGIVAATPENIDNLEMKKVVLRNFSDIATPTEAAQKLRNMKMTSDQPIASYNYNYAVVHEAAFDINPSEQRMRFALEDYANSLPEYTADKLSYKIVKVDSWIKTLQDTMDHAVKIDQESRQSEVMRNRRNNSSELIDTTVNEISDIDINYVASRQGESRFNSTMKPGYQREGKDFSPRN